MEMTTMATTTTHTTPAFRSAVDALYAARQARMAHPAGTFDKAGRWWPAESEQCPCCHAVRSPSRAWPYSLMTHCRTRKHIAAMLAQNASATTMQAAAR
jgi:hypothetical protein